MQPHDDEFEKLGVDVNRMLRALPRERDPGPGMEDAIAQLLSKRGLLVAGGQPARIQRPRKRVAITWPAATAAAVALFVSGVIVGASSSRGGAPAASPESVASAPDADVAPQRGADLLLVSDKPNSVTKAIRF